MSTSQPSPFVVPFEPVRVQGVEHDQCRYERAHGAGERVERCVCAEEGHPPAPPGQEHAEGDQAQVVGLARQAGQEHQRAQPRAPVAGKAEQPAADQAGREVFLRHRCGTGRPPLPQVVQVRDEHLGQRGLHGDGGEQAVEGGVRRLVVKGVKRRDTPPFSRR